MFRPRPVEENQYQSELMEVTGAGESYTKFIDVGVGERGWCDISRHPTCDAPAYYYLLIMIRRF